MKILMFFHNGSKNRGCEAIVRSGVELIKGENPDAVIDLASKSPETDRIIPLVNSIFLDERKSLRKFSIPWFISAIRVKLFNDDRYAFRVIHSDIIDKIPHYDLFLSIGGDNYCYGEQPGIYEIDRQIKKAGKKLVLWGASIGEEDLSPAKIEDLKSFDLVLARESLTYQTLLQKGITNVKLCADGAFTMNKEELILPKDWKEGNTIGFNFSPLVAKKNKESLLASQNLIRHILATTDMTIALTPHVMEPGNDDYVCLTDFYNMFKDSGRVILLPNDLTAIQYKGYIARMRFFIGARTHATIAAYSNYVPTLVLGYSVKSKGIAKDIFGYERLVLNLSEISDSEKLKAKFAEMLRDEVDIKAVLEQKIPQIREMSGLAAKYLFEI